MVRAIMKLVFIRLSGCIIGTIKRPKNLKCEQGTEIQNFFLSLGLTILRFTENYLLYYHIFVISNNAIVFLGQSSGAI